MNSLLYIVKTLNIINILMGYILYLRYKLNSDCSIGRFSYSEITDKENYQ